jgi:hypothetical protein
MTGHVTCDCSSETKNKTKCEDKIWMLVQHMGKPPDDGKLCRCAYEMLGNLGAPPFRSFSFPPLETPPSSRSHAMAGLSIYQGVWHSRL